MSFSGPTVVYVAASVAYAGTMTDTVGDGSLLLAYSGILPVTMGGKFIGTFVAPNAPITVSAPSQVGAFFAHDIELSPGTTLQHESFQLPPSSCVGATDGSACSGNGSGTAVCESGTCINVTCADNNGASGDTQTLTVSDDLGAGVVTYTHTSTNSRTSPPTSTTTISLAGQPLETATVVGSQPQTTSVVFGSAFHGVHEFDTTATATTITGVVDGRSLNPVPTNATPTVVFTDGNPPPTLVVDDGVLAMIAKITKLAQKGLGVCPAPPAPIKVLGGTLPPFETAGHTTNDDTLASCQTCTDDCDRSWESCIAASDGTASAAAIGAAFVPPPFDVIGIFASFLGGGIADEVCTTSQSGCNDACFNIGSGCCPNDCGGPGLCCASARSVSTPARVSVAPRATLPALARTSCVDLTQAACLGSGAGCPTGVPTCGSGNTEVCCPSGTCVQSVPASADLRHHREHPDLVGRRSGLLRHGNRVHAGCLRNVYTHRNSGFNRHLQRRGRSGGPGRRHGQLHGSRI